MEKQGVAEKSPQNGIPQNNDAGYWSVLDPQVGGLLQNGLKIPEPLQRLLHLIITITGADKIFWLGASREDQPDRQIAYALLIMVPGIAAHPYSDYETIVEHISERIHPVTAEIHKAAELYRMLSAGHIYYSRICQPENLVYDNGFHPLPVPDFMPTTALLDKAQKDFDRGLDKSKDFLEGAGFYAAHHQKQLAAFLLHQAVEQVFQGVAYALTAHQLVSHNLNNLMRRCRLCAPELSRLFPADTENERRLLSLLQKAYVHTRYKDHYDISDQDLSLLFDRTKRLQSTAIHIFRQKLGEAEMALGKQLLDGLS